MTYDEALDWWFSHVNFEQRTPTPRELKLDRMRALLQQLGDPHRNLRIVHIAGSKGKGSTAAMLASIAQQAGYRTGLFTSPHLSHLEERFQVDGKPITAPELTQLLGEIRQVLEASRSFRNRPPTFFEIATALGLLHFLRRRVEVVLLEVGLGGRLDSTNVCSPRLSVITSISYDHTRILGDKLALIAREKAGIIKPGCPVVSGVTAPEAREVIASVSQQQRAPLMQLERDFRFQYHPGQVSASGYVPARVEVQTSTRKWPLLEIGLLGEHQGANAAVVLACVEQLNQQGWHLSDQAVVRGLAQVHWPARLEVMNRRPFLLLDCAHNVASAEALVETLRQSFPSGRRLLVFACSADKDIAGIFQVFAPVFSHAYLTRYTTSSRSVPPEQLAEWWRERSQVPCTVVSTPQEALRLAQAAAGPEDLVCLTGSVFLAGEVRPLLCGEREFPSSGPDTFSLAKGGLQR